MDEFCVCMITMLLNPFQLKMTYTIQKFGVSLIIHKAINTFQKECIKSDLLQILYFCSIHQRILEKRYD